MKHVARLCLALAVLLLMLNAHIHHSTSGISCSPWPHCYSLIGKGAAAPVPWLLTVQEIITGLLALATLLLGLVSFRDGRHRTFSLAALGLVFLLTWLEWESREAHHPALVVSLVVTVFTLLGAMGWLLFRLNPGAARYTETRIRQARPAVLAALVLMSTQVVLGALNTANYTARSCPGLLTCDGAWFPDATIYASLRVDRPYTISGDGHATGNFERQAIQLAHRWTAALMALVAAWVALVAFGTTETLRRLGLAALTLAVAELVVGVAAAMTGIPRWLSLAHPVFAAALLLVLLKMHALSKERWWHDYSNVSDNTTPDWDRIVSSRSSR